MEKLDYSNMSIYKKIQLVKQRLLESNLKKSGENKYAGFKYYELGDFIPTIINLCNEAGLFTKVTFTNEVAMLKIINSDKPEQYEEYTSPMRELELKGCNQIQALGGTETYSRRYLYMSAFDITENDMFDGTNDDVEVTLEFAKKYILKFGKNKDKKLVDCDEGYIDWLLNNTEDLTILKCIELLFNKKKPSEDELDERIKLLADIEKLSLEKNITRESLYQYYKVESDSQMTIEQLKDCLERLKK